MPITFIVAELMQMRIVVRNSLLIGSALEKYLWNVTKIASTVALTPSKVAETPKSILITRLY